MGVRRGVDRVIRLGRARGEFDADKGGGGEGRELRERILGERAEGKGMWAEGYTQTNNILYIYRPTRYALPLPLRGKCMG